MKMRIKAFAKLTGVSVRTLHYYDQIGLLTPAEVDEENGYRFYDEQSLERMQAVLFYRELDFSLASIQSILSSPAYDKAAALQMQKQLLILKRDRLSRLITEIERAQKEESIMDMKAFDSSEILAAKEQYAKEVKERWGNTDAYRECAEKTDSYRASDWKGVYAGMNDIFAQFAACRAAGHSPESEPAQALVERLKQYITDHFYDCTNEILAGLGQMYVADERFMQNIDKSGEGTAEFVSQAISAQGLRSHSADS